MWVGLKKVFEPELNPKYSPSAPKNVKKGPKWAQIENKRKGFTY